MQHYIATEEKITNQICRKTVCFYLLIYTGIMGAYVHKLINIT